ncbi:hypothetical protein GQ457_03G010970 [Hibiscus cannabinus]
MALASKQASPFPLLLLLLLLFLLFVKSSNCAPDTFVFGGCSQLKFISGSPYEYNVDSILTSLVNSAMFTSYNNFTIPASGSASEDTVYGLFQCRGDLNNGDCGRCVAKAASQLGTLCLDSTGGVLQLEGCLVRYDNTTFLGVEDKSVVVRRCGPLISTSSDALARRDAVLAYLGLGASDKPFRIGGSGDLRGVAQCVGDLSPSECQDCISEAIGGLKTDCGAAQWGDMYLAKCYVRYSEGGDHWHGGNDTNNNDEEIEKTLAILIGLIAGVALIIVFASFLSKLCGKGGGK